MKKISIISLPFLLAACSSGGDYVTEVTSDSFREEYKTEAIVETIASNTVTEQVIEDKVTPAPAPAKRNKVNVVKVTRTAPVAHQQVTQNASAMQKKSVKIIPPTQKQVAKYKRFGFTIQVIAVDSSAKAQMLAKKLPDEHPVWEHYKQVNGTEWYTLLYGDYATRGEAKSAIQTLPQMFRDLKPFVKSLDDVKNSPYPKLNKLR